MSIRPVFRVAAAGLDERDFRLIEIVFKHSQYNRYDFQLLPRPDPQQTDILIVNPVTPSGLDALSALREYSRDIPAVSALPRGTQAAARHAITIDRLTLQLLPTLNRVVEIEGLEDLLGEKAGGEKAEGQGKEHGVAGTDRSADLPEPVATAAVATAGSGPGTGPEPGTVMPGAARPRGRLIRRADDPDAIRRAATWPDAGPAADGDGDGDGDGDDALIRGDAEVADTEAASHYAPLIRRQVRGSLPARGESGHPAADPAVSVSVANGSQGGAQIVELRAARASAAELRSAEDHPGGGPLRRSPRSSNIRIEPRIDPDLETDLAGIPTVANRIALPEDASPAMGASTVDVFAPLGLDALFAADRISGPVRPADSNPVATSAASSAAGLAGASARAASAGRAAGSMPATVHPSSSPGPGSAEARDLAELLKDVAEIPPMTVALAARPIPVPPLVTIDAPARPLPLPLAAETPQRGTHAYPLQILVADPSLAAQQQIVRAATQAKKTLCIRVFDSQYAFVARII